MTVQDLLPWITGSGGALVVLAVVCWAFYSGKIHSDGEFRKVVQENDALKAAREDDHKAIEETARTGTVTNQLIAALVKVSTQKHGDHDRRTGREQGAGLTPDDLGL